MDEEIGASQLFEAAIEAYLKKRGVPDVYSDRDFDGEIFQMEGLRARILRMYREGIPTGENPGWSGLEPYYRPCRGQWTVVTGIPRHGKSEWLDALIINLIRLSSWKIGIFSPENYPLEYHSKKLIEKYSGFPMHEGPNERLSEGDLSFCINALDHKLFLLDPEDDHMNVDSMLDMARFLKLKKGIDGFVIDPWNELDHTRPPFETETDYIGRQLTKVRRFARKENIHVWVVAHPAKLYRDKEGKYPVPTLYDISGSAHWANKADFAIVVWRDISQDYSPTQVHVQKCRFRWFGQTGCAELRWDHVSGRYFDC